MPEPAAEPPPPGDGWMREYAETITQPEPPVADSGPVTPLEIMQMQGDTGVAQAAAQLGSAESGLAAAPAGAMPDGFLLDPERAEAAVATMEQVVVDLRRAQILWKPGAAFDPPGADEVSRNLAANARVMADRADTYVTDYARQVEEVVLALRAQVEAYRRVEQANTARQA